MSDDSRRTKLAKAAIRGAAAEIVDAHPEAAKSLFDAWAAVNGDEDAVEAIVKKLVRNALKPEKP